MKEFLLDTRTGSSVNTKQPQGRASKLGFDEILMDESVSRLVWAVKRVWDTLRTFEKFVMKSLDFSAEGDPCRFGTTRLSSLFSIVTAVSWRRNKFVSWWPVRGKKNPREEGSFGILFRFFPISPWEFPKALHFLKLIYPQFQLICSWPLWSSVDSEYGRRTYSRVFGEQFWSWSVRDPEIWQLFTLEDCANSFPLQMLKSFPISWLIDRNLKLIYRIDSFDSFDDGESKMDIADTNNETKKRTSAGITTREFFLKFK